jgi:hypothetical protein
MELLLALGVAAVLVLALMGGYAFLKERRAGTVLAVPISSRNLAARASRSQRGRASSAHK